MDEIITSGDKEVINDADCRKWPHENRIARQESQEALCALDDFPRDDGESEQCIQHLTSANVDPAREVARDV